MPLGIPCTVDGEDGTIPACEEGCGREPELGSTMCNQCQHAAWDRENGEGERPDQDFGSAY